MQRTNVWTPKENEADGMSWLMGIDAYKLLIACIKQITNVKLLYSTGLACLLSHIQLFATPCTVACQAPLSMGFYRQEYWNGQPFPSPGDLPNMGTEPGSPAWQADCLPYVSNLQMRELRFREVTGSPKLTWLVRSRASFKILSADSELACFLIPVHSFIHSFKNNKNH